MRIEVGQHFGRVHHAGKISAYVDCVCQKQSCNRDRDDGTREFAFNRLLVSDFDAEVVDAVEEEPTTRPRSCEREYQIGRLSILCVIRSCLRRKNERKRNGRACVPSRITCR